MYDKNHDLLLSVVLQASRDEHPHRDCGSRRGVLLGGLVGAADAARGRVGARPAQVLLQCGVYHGTITRRTGPAHGHHQVRGHDNPLLTMKQLLTMFQVGKVCSNTASARRISRRSGWACSWTPPSKGLRQLSANHEKVVNHETAANFWKKVKVVQILLHTAPVRRAGLALGSPSE